MNSRIKSLLSCVLAVILVVSCMSFITNADSTNVSLAATFTLGEDGTPGHKDGSEFSNYEETNEGFILSITEINKAYKDALDAIGNGCLKLGTSKAAGEIEIAVPENVVKVVICAAKYKADKNNATVNANGTETVLTKASDKGEYDVITVDTSEIKTINFKVVAGFRCMINTIEFYVANASGDDTSEESETPVESSEEPSEASSEESSEEPAPADKEYKFSFIVDGAKKYIDIVARTDKPGSVNVAIVDEPTNTFRWNEELGVYTVTIDDVQFYLGTFNNNATFSGSNISYITGEYKSKVGVSQFPAKFAKNGDKYVLTLHQAVLGKDLYFTGAMNSYYFAASENIADAVAITIEVVGDTTPDESSEEPSETSSEEPSEASSEEPSETSSEEPSEASSEEPSEASSEEPSEASSTETTTEEPSKEEPSTPAPAVKEYRFSFTVDGAKKYIDIVARPDKPGSVNVVIVDEPTNAFRWNEELGVYTVTIDDVQFYLGTFNNNATFSGSNISYITGEYKSKVGVSQFPAKFAKNGDKYVLTLHQAVLGKDLYFTGAMNSYYFAASENIADAVAITIEVVGGDEPVATGDAGLIIFSVISVLSLAGVVIIRKRK